MAGPLDILRGIAGGAGDKRAPRPGMPSFTSQDWKTLQGIEATIESIGDAAKKGSENWGKLGDARALLPAKKALSALRRAQSEFNLLMVSGTATVEEQAEAYDKLAKARQKSTQELQKAQADMNESRGILGRTKNVLDDLAKHKWAAIMAAAVKDLNMGKIWESCRVLLQIVAT